MEGNANLSSWRRANYFDTVLLPRIKKVAFTPEWKEGKAQAPRFVGRRLERSPRIVKVVRLESYEETHSTTWRLAAPTEADKSYSTLPRRKARMA